MNIRDLIPTHPHDTLQLKKLKHMEYEEYKPIIKDLLEWTKDGNWSTAKILYPIFLDVGEKVIPEIKELLEKSDEDDWKYFVLTDFVDQLPNTLKLQFEDQLVRFKEHPTLGEKSEELDYVSTYILESIEDDA